MNSLRRWRRDAVAAAATLSGKRFGLLVASSLVATSAIVASALTGAGESGALAALLANRQAPAAAPSAAVEPAAEATEPSAPTSSASTQPQSSSEPFVPVEEPAPAPTTPSSAPPSEPEAPATTAPAAGRVKHVFVISLASPGYEATFGSPSQMPYLAETLRPQGELLSGYSLLDASPLPNEIAAISGQPPSAKTKEGCPQLEACLFGVEELTLADQMTAGHFGWHGYMEAMVDERGKPGNCVHSESESPLGGYATQRNPFVYFHSLLDLGDCALNDVPLTKLEGDLAKADSVAGYNLISPDLCDAGVPGQCPAGAPSGAAAADTFLSTWVPKILASPAYENDGLLVIAFDSLDPPDPTTGQPAAETQPKVGALLLSPFVSPGSTDAAPYGPYSLLRSVEDLFGLPQLGLAAGQKVKSLAPALLGETGGD